MVKPMIRFISRSSKLLLISSLCLALGLLLKAGGPTLEPTASVLLGLGMIGSIVELFRGAL
jgi:hypothetical protein